MRRVGSGRAGRRGLAPFHGLHTKSPTQGALDYRLKWVGVGAELARAAA